MAKEKQAVEEKPASKNEIEFLTEDDKKNLAKNYHDLKTVKELVDFKNAKLKQFRIEKQQIKAARLLKKQEKEPTDENDKKLWNHSNFVILRLISSAYGSQFRQLLESSIDKVKIPEHEVKAVERYMKDRYADWKVKPETIIKKSAPEKKSGDLKINKKREQQRKISIELDYLELCKKIESLGDFENIKKAVSYEMSMGKQNGIVEFLNKKVPKDEKKEPAEKK